MIARVVTVWIMTEVSRCPAIGGMAYIALLNGIQMAIRFRCRASIRCVAAITVANGAGIMDPYSTDECCCGVTVVTIQRSIEVSWIDLRIFAFCGDTIMTGFTVIDDTCVVESCTGESSSGMAGTAVLVCYQVSIVFANSKSTIMAGHTIAYDANVIKCPRYESGRLMTYTAVIIGRYMIRWRCLASGGRTIVTSCAVINDIGMVEAGTCKGCGVMTNRTVFTGWEVIQWFDGTDSIGTIMT
jgi:hypothetical protein